MVKFADGLPKLGAATCRIELPSGKIDPACHRGFPTPWNALAYIFGLEKLFPKLKIFGGYHQGWKNYSSPHEVDVISGAFFMIPRKVIDKVGLLDESFFMYGEDIDWCFRIKQAGFEIWYNREVKILHYKKQSGRDKKDEGRRTKDEGIIKRQAEYHFAHTMEQFYRKHYVDKYPRLVNWVVLLAINIWKKTL
jgi:GT2 family glycosyltransferase